MLIKTVKLLPGDLESVERVLSALVEASARAPEARPEHSAPDLLQFGRLVFALRRDRCEFLHPAMLGEPAFDMLLALYIADESAEVTLAKLADLSGVPQSSGLRWIDYLCSKKLISRTRHPSDGRAWVLRLTETGRAALDGLLGSMLGRLTAFTQRS